MSDPAAEEDAFLAQALFTDSPRAGNLVASSYQALAEGGVYFANVYFYSLWLRHAFTSSAGGSRGSRSVRARAAVAALVLPLGGLVFRTYACVRNGWPQPIIYGSATAGKRLMLSTIGFRFPQLVGIAVLLAQPQARAAWLPLVSVQLPLFLYFFFMLRFMGRSYVETAEANASGQGGGPLPLFADVASNVFRACEPIMGGAMVLLVTLAASGKLFGEAEDTKARKRL